MKNEVITPQQTFEKYLCAGIAVKINSMLSSIVVKPHSINDKQCEYNGEVFDIMNCWEHFTSGMKCVEVRPLFD